MDTILIPDGLELADLFDSSIVHCAPYETESELQYCGMKRNENADGIDIGGSSSFIIRKSNG